MYVNELDIFVRWLLFVIPNKSARVCSNILGDTVIYSMNSEKKSYKISHVSTLRQEKRADLSMMFPGQLKMRRNKVHSYCSVNFL